MSKALAMATAAAACATASLGSVSVSNNGTSSNARALSSPFFSSAASLRMQSPRCASRFTSLLISAPGQSRRSGSDRNAIVAIDPDFYKIPHVQGIPQGTRLKLFNLPPTDDRERLQRDLIEWFTTIEDDPVTVTGFEYTDDPEWNAQGVGAFVDFETKWQAVTAYARLDASKFQGRYVRMDFVERKPFPPEWLAKNAKWFSGQYGNMPTAKIFVGNLAWTVDDAKLQNLFAGFGTVYDAKVLTDRETGRSRGFGFVTMSSDEEMNKAISALNGTQLEGRTLRVNEAAKKPQ